MKKAYMIMECVGDSIYEAHTIPYVYLERTWAEHQMRVLEEDCESDINFRIREVQIVESGPNQ